MPLKVRMLVRLSVHLKFNSLQKMDDFQGDWPESASGLPPRARQAFLPSLGLIPPEEPCPLHLGFRRP